MATVSLKTRASERTSGGPSRSGARASRSPAPTATAAGLEAAQGSRDEAREPPADERGGREHDRRDPGQQEPVAADARVERSRSGT